MQLSITHIFLVKRLDSSLTIFSSVKLSKLFNLVKRVFLQCFDTVGWAPGRASGPEIEWVGFIHGLGWVAFSSTCDGLGRLC